MNIRSRLILFSASLLLFPAALIAILSYTLHFRLQWDASLDEGSVFAFLGRYYGQILLAVLLLGAILTVLSSLLFLRDILRPLKELRKIATEIENGNLDLEIRYDIADEFSPVFAQFDHMRIHIKDLLWQKVKDEETRVDMIANIAHDFKTPVTSIQGYAQGLLDGVASSEEKRQQYLTTIIQKSNDLGRMADELYLLSTLENNAQPFEKVSVPAGPFFEELMAELTGDYPLVRMSIDNLLTTPDASIAIDPQQCRRVFANILQNSAKYRRHDVVQVCATVSETPTSVVFCMADDGVGVPKEDMSQIFDRFYRADGARRSTSQGSGLGLSIARQIVEAQRGKIWGQGNDRGGLSVYISFPKAADIWGDP